MSNALPMIFFPGMGADERLFASQRAAFANLVVPGWLAPRPDESLPDYAARFAAQVDPGTDCIVGGASFGGFVAVEIARHLRARACFLIGSARGPSELPLRIRTLRGVRRLLPRLPFEWAAPLATSSGAASGWAMGPAQRGVLRQLADADAAFLRWACGAVLTWPEPPPLAAPIFQIHGARDHVLPARRTRADVIVPGAGHLLAVTHPRHVNRFIEQKSATLE
jgi:pimeloyl-ACP methyl ester carboxylesterase